MASLLILSLLCAFLSSGQLIASQSTSACRANCSISLNDNPAVGWKSIEAQETVTDIIILIYDEQAGTTETRYSSATITVSGSRINLPPTNSAGTVTETVTVGSSSLVLTYPAESISWVTRYSVAGTIPTKTGSISSCMVAPSGTFLDYPPEALASLTQPPVSFPTGGDRFGIYYTAYNYRTGYPKWWTGALNSTYHVGAWESCARWTVAPAGAVQEVLVLTSISRSTKNGVSTPTTTSNQAVGSSSSTISTPLRSTLGGSSTTSSSLASTVNPRSTSSLPPAATDMGSTVSQLASALVGPDRGSSSLSRTSSTAIASPQQNSNTATKSVSTVQNSLGPVAISSASRTNSAQASQGSESHTELHILSGSSTRVIDAQDTGAIASILASTSSRPDIQTTGVGDIIADGLGFTQSASTSSRPSQVATNGCRKQVWFDHALIIACLLLVYSQMV